MVKTNKLTDNKRWMLHEKTAKIVFLSQDIACTTHRPGPWLWHWVVVGVPLLRLPVDLSVAPAEGSFHLCHAESAHC